MLFKMNSNPAEAISRKEKITDEIVGFQNKVTKKFTPADSTKIMTALDFMLKIHLPQADRVDGKPFATHPLAVAEKVMELSDNPELVIAALFHDSVEDQPDHIFIERVNKKYPGRPFTYLQIDDHAKEKYKATFRDWSFREIQERFGDKVKYYVENMTNHDYNSLVEDSGLQGEAKQDLINKLYAEHVEGIINDPELFTLKLADLAVNIDLHSLDPESAKYHKLKRKYKSVIEAMLQKLDNIDASHPIYSKKAKIKDELTQIYNEQYNK